MIINTSMKQSVPALTELNLFQLVLITSKFDHYKKKKNYYSHVNPSYNELLCSSKRLKIKKKRFLYYYFDKLIS